MNPLATLDLFQGISTLIDSFQNNPAIAVTRVGLIFLGMLLVYLGKKGTLEPLLMIPMGIAMCAVNAGVLFLDTTTSGYIARGSYSTAAVESATAAIKKTNEALINAGKFDEPVAAALKAVLNDNVDAAAAAQKHAAPAAQVTAAVTSIRQTTADIYKAANDIVKDGAVGNDAAATTAAAKIGGDTDASRALAAKRVAATAGELAAAATLNTPATEIAAAAAAIATASAGKTHGTLFMSPLVEEPNALVGLMGIDFLQPVFSFTFGNNLIACMMFMGIGVLLDVGYVLARPFFSISMALFCELGTLAVYPIAIALGLKPGEAASIALVGGADGPMVLFGALQMAPKLLVPITIIAYLYLGLVYGGYPYLIRALIPLKLRAIKPPPRKIRKITSGQKLAFAVVICTLLCLLFPVGAPLFFCLFLGVAVREAEILPFARLTENVFLYGATMFLGILLGVMCEAQTILDPKVILLLVLGVLSLFLSGVGGVIGGYVAYLLSGRKLNPVVAIAGVSCVPSTAKVVQKEVSKASPGTIVLPDALGINIAGVITTAVITALYVSFIKMM